MCAHVSRDLICQLSGIPFQIINNCDSQNESPFLQCVYVYHSINLDAFGGIFTSCVGVIESFLKGVYDKKEKGIWISSFNYLFRIPLFCLRNHFSIRQSVVLLIPSLFAVFSRFIFSSKSILRTISCSISPSVFVKSISYCT